jgi:hypothetical protein
VKHLVYHIIRLALAILLVMLTVAFAAAQMRVPKGETTELSVIQEGNNTYTWDLYSDPTVDFATEDGNALSTEAFFVGGINTGSTVNVTWLEPGIYFFRVLAVDEEDCTNHVKVGIVEVLDLPTAELSLDPLEICIGEPAVLTVTLTGVPAWGFTLQGEDLDGNIIETFDPFENILDTDNPVEIIVSPDQTTIYRVVRVVDQNGENLDASESIQLTVHPLPENSQIYQID